jgi:hypothetical protein
MVKILKLRDASPSMECTPTLPNGECHFYTRVSAFSPAFNLQSNVTSKIMLTVKHPCFLAASRPPTVSKSPVDTVSISMQGLCVHTFYFMSFHPKTRRKAAF